MTAATFWAPGLPRVAGLDAAYCLLRATLLPPRDLGPATDLAALAPTTAVCGCGGDKDKYVSDKEDGGKVSEEEGETHRSPLIC